MRGGKVGVLDLSDPTNVFSALAFTVATNELDAIGGLVTIWNENPLHKKQTGINYFYPSISHPGLYVSPFDWPENSDALYRYEFNDGRHWMWRVD